MDWLPEERQSKEFSTVKLSLPNFQQLWHLLRSSYYFLNLQLKWALVRTVTSWRISTALWQLHNLKFDEIRLFKYKEDETSLALLAPGSCTYEVLRWGSVFEHYWQRFSGRRPFENEEDFKRLARFPLAPSPPQTQTYLTSMLKLCLGMRIISKSLSLRHLSSMLNLMYRMKRCSAWSSVMTALSITAMLIIELSNVKIW